MTTIKTFDYRRGLAAIEDELLNAVRRVLHSGCLILGPETEAFEREFADWVGAKHAVGVSSGTTALHLALMALGIGPGDEVITVANTCVPTVSAIRLTGATPVFVDVQEEDLMMASVQVENAISGRTRCILPVHLWGQAAELDRLGELARKYGLILVEDCAQAHGTRYRGRHVGTFGEAGCFSFYPTKNLGAYGDAGAVVTDDDALAARLRRLRMYGYDDRAISIAEGMNARIAEVHAAMLRIKLRNLDESLVTRRNMAALYDSNIRATGIRLPYRHPHTEHAFHQYVICCDERSAVCDALKARDIGYGIHYPTPLHRHPGLAGVYRAPCELSVTEWAAEHILSLPMHDFIAESEVEQTANVINLVNAVH